MLFSQGNVEEACAPPLRRLLFDAVVLPRFVSGALTHFDRAVPRRPPTLLLRTLVVTLVMVVTILLSVFLVLILDLRARVRGEVADVLETDSSVLASVQARRAADVAARLAALTANPTFEAALQKHTNAYGSFTPQETRQSMVWLEGALRPIADEAEAGIAAIVDARGVTMAQAGTAEGEWPERPELARPADAETLREATLRLGTTVHFVASRPVFLRRQCVATLCLAWRLDRAAAGVISEVTRAHTLLRLDGQILGSTLDAATTEALQSGWRPGVEKGEVKAGGEWYAWRRLSSSAGVEVFALAPLGTPASRTTASAFRAVLGLALGSLVLAVVGSFWLARRIAAPIDTMSRALSTAVTARDFDVRLEADGGSREIEDLTRTFNELMAGLSKAEAESRSASLDAIEALAKALEARDIYTAGHSERVGELAVRLGEELGLAAGELEVLRLGASLHDIGKIGVTDLVLRKPTALTSEERCAIEVHPLVGARILRPVTSLAAHLPIVELHHERPDGRGYPHGLSGSAIPLPARIVHLADAYDAMTSDRPYRGGRPSAEAVLEIVRGRGTEFDADVVDAFVRVIGDDVDVPLSASSLRSSRPARTPAEDSVASCT